MSNDRLPYARQWIDDRDVESVLQALRGPLLTQGSQISSFERELAAYCGAPYAVAVSSGTAALHLAARASGLTTGTSLLTSPMTFVASAAAGVMCGATPRFTDIDPETRNLSLRGVTAEIEKQAPKAIIAVHYAGWPVDMPRLQELARPAGAALIEDGCHALGAEYRDGSGAWHTVGACHHSDMTCFSFHPVKHITTGEGGAITTRSEALYRQLLKLRSHGMERDPAYLVERHGPWYYDIQDAAPNYRMSDILAALGRSQLARQPEWLARRRELAKRYDAQLAGLRGVVAPGSRDGARSAYHLYPIWIDEQACGLSRLQVFEALQARNIAVQVHYVPIHLFSYYRERFGTAPGQYLEAERFYSGEISLPMFPQMNDADLDRVVTALREIVGAGPRRLG